MAEINKKSLEHLADLARIELSENETEKFLKDLGNILNYFKELEGLDTKDVAPMTGGTSLKNVMRADMPFEKDRFDRPDKIMEAFPEKERRQLKVPPVF